MALLEVRDLSRWFDLERQRRLLAVDRVSLTLQPDEVVGLVGESGSGKSTLGRCLIGLLEKSAGEVWFDGERLPARYRTEDFRRHGSAMRMIFQDPYSSLNPRMTVLEIVGEGLRLQGERDRGRIRDQVAHWLQRVGLSAEQMGRYPHEFSGGQRQRIGIARALISRPRFVVCDEPISALDVSVQAQVVNLLAALRAEMGLTLLFIAHDLSMVRHLCDRVAVMYLGQLVELGPTEQLFSQPRHPYSRLLIESNPIADPQRERARQLPLIQGEMPSPIDLPPGCRFAGRCPQALPICHREPPVARPVDPHHWRACHLD
ncbi:MAG: ATP-binding cassette domain-containing protein [Pseudomonadales bacterium]|nr:ATP-binding cassette domain-containing protein [Pseudomonadales bacterium]MCP5332445.1 ATP-binding cassette domain-containing protein [Pseudomonadales bacterium]HMU90628.1 ATP-binding cassette domain-containing protein [Pseudomonadales bacterium]HMW15495.1 ATP-binding cassette domain-containing protein [Pseudomonadales bacterium]HNB84484.1 ATP-binding cassette domain-containing protein [Pseudomonadales bacterium]